MITSYSRKRKANQNASTAYWIAFGPHGPRALPPPDEPKKVITGVLVGVFASLVIFSASRMFAKPAPHTMNKEWQEEANEYLKVRLIPCSIISESSFTDCLNQSRNKKLTPSLVSPTPSTRARARFSPLPRRLKQQQQLDSSFPLSLERTETKSFPHGLSTMYKMIFRRSIGATRVWTGGGDFTCGCKYVLYENYQHLLKERNNLLDFLFYFYKAWISCRGRSPSW